MEACRSTAFCLTLWHAVLTVIVTALGIALYDLEGPIALLVAANVALLFAVVLMARAGSLSEKTITRSLYWRTLPSRERPRGEAGVRIAQRAVSDMLLTFAKGAAAVAVVCAGLAYASNSGGGIRVGEGEPRPGADANAIRRARRRLSLGAPAADELKQHLAPVRPRAVLGEINALPGAERELAARDRHVQRNPVQHRLHVRRHVVRAFGVVHPAGVRRAQAGRAR